MSVMDAFARYEVERRVGSAGCVADSSKHSVKENHLIACTVAADSVGGGIRIILANGGARSPQRARDLIGRWIGIGIRLVQIGGVAVEH